MKFSTLYSFLTLIQVSPCSLCSLSEWHIDWNQTLDIILHFGKMKAQMGRSEKLPLCCHKGKHLNFWFCRVRNLWPAHENISWAMSALPWVQSMALLRDKDTMLGRRLSFLERLPSGTWSKKMLYYQIWEKCLHIRLFPSMASFGLIVANDHKHDHYEEAA